MKIRGQSIGVVYDAEIIAGRNVELAEDIARAGYDNLLVVSILKGSFVFAADLIRALHGAGMSPEVEFISVSSYRDGTVSLVRGVSALRCYSTNRANWSIRSKPITSVSAVRTCSSSATAWTRVTRSANCRLSASLRITARTAQRMIAPRICRAGAPDIRAPAPVARSRLAAGE